jgi:hypothetical protein
VGQDEQAGAAAAAAAHSVTRYAKPTAEPPRTADAPRTAKTPRTADASRTADARPAAAPTTTILRAAGAPYCRQNDTKVPPLRTGGARRAGKTGAGGAGAGGAGAGGAGGRHWRRTRRW